MKLSELFLTQEDQTKHAESKLKGLKRAIEDGDAPLVSSQTRPLQGHGMKDLEALGFAFTDYKSASGHPDDSDVYNIWVYDGPGPITMKKPGGTTVVVQPGTEIDW